MYPTALPARLRSAAPWIVCLLAALALRAPSLPRAGLSPDEEITIFAVRGISAHGLPVLPSGVIYERGLLFSYASWMAQLFAGQELLASRCVSLLAGSALVLVLACLARRLGGSAVFAGTAACAAAWLVASSTWGRFYAPFVLGVVGTTMLWLSGRTSRGAARWSLVAFVATCLLHETAVALVALPLFDALEKPPRSDEQRDARRRLVVWCATAVVVEILLAALAGNLARASPTQLIAAPAAAGRWPFMPISLHTASPAALAAMSVGALTIGVLLHKRGGPWMLSIAAVGCAMTLNVGALALVAAGITLARPEAHRRLLGSALLGAVGILALWTVFLSTTTASALSLELIGTVLRAAVVLPFAAMAFLLRQWPVLTVAGVLGLYLGRDRSAVRMTAFVTVATIAFLGLLPLAPKARYVLPVSALLLVLASIVPERTARLFTEPSRQSAARWITTAALLALVLFEDRRAASTERLLAMTHGLPQVRTISFEGLKPPADAPPSRPLVCNDDLLCLLAGRAPDVLWLTSKPEADALGIRTGERWRSLYTNAPIVIGREGLVAATAGRNESDVVLFGGPKHDAGELASMLPGDGWRVESDAATGDVHTFRLQRNR